MGGSTIYVEGASGLHNLHPLTKLSLTLLFLVMAATSPSLLWLLAAFVLLLVPLAAWGRVLSPFLKGLFTIIVPFTISLFLIQGFFTPGVTVLFRLGSFTFTLEGAVAGLTAAARILLAFSGALLLMLSTRPDHLMLSLTQRGVPYKLAFIVLTVLQIIPRFQERAETILNAQQARGLEMRTSLLGRFRLLVPLVGPLVLSSIVDVEERAMALEARAFSRPGPKTSLLVLRDSVAQRAFRWLIIALSVGLIVARVVVWR